MSDYKSKQCMPLTIARSMANLRRGGAEPERVKCIGPDCAMWREGWIDAEVDVFKGEPPVLGRKRIGYCGLAGKPEIVI